MESNQYDVVILGAGAAGMMCAIQAGKRGRRVLLLDHSTRLGGKILISGGGRCNFTNIGASPSQYVSKNPHFCKSALSRYPAQAFIQLVQEHGIAFHEKKLGQLFCDESARQIVELMRSECEAAQVQIQLGCKIQQIQQIQNTQLNRPRFKTEVQGSDPTSNQKHVSYTSQSLVVATGGLSIPKIGATGLGYEIARQFGIQLIPRAAALDGFVFSDAQVQSFRQLSGISVDCVMSCNGVSFRENLLFTHTGLSGPAALQTSLHWNPGDKIQINLLPNFDSFKWFLDKKRRGSRATVKNLLCEILPSRLAECFYDLYFASSTQVEPLPLPQVSEKSLEAFCQKLHHWELSPSGTVGYSKAEVTRGGVDTDELSSKTMESRKVPGLYFIGEVVDVTGWLGGYNFQWAWASGWAAGQNV